MAEAEAEKSAGSAIAGRGVCRGRESGEHDYEPQMQESGTGVPGKIPQATKTTLCKLSSISCRAILKVLP